MQSIVLFFFFLVISKLTLRKAHFAFIIKNTTM